MEDKGFRNFIHCVKFSSEGLDALNMRKLFVQAVSLDKDNIVCFLRNEKKQINELVLIKPNNNATITKTLYGSIEGNFFMFLKDESKEQEYFNQEQKYLELKEKVQSLDLHGTRINSFCKALGLSKDRLLFHVSNVGFHTECGMNLAIEVLTSHYNYYAKSQVDLVKIEQMAERII